MSHLREIRFRDPRPPPEIRSALERELMARLAPEPGAPRLTYRATAQAGGVPFRVTLRFDAALAQANRYTLVFDAVAPAAGTEEAARQRRTLDGWFDLFTRSFTAETLPLPTSGSEERYAELVRQADRAESHLVGVPAIQGEILRGLRRGLTFTTAHKEGGTTIRYENGRYVRADYGDSSTVEEFTDEAEFLAFLRRFFDWETSRGSYPGKASDFDAWMLILRLLTERRSTVPPAAPLPVRVSRVKLIAALAVAGVALVFVLLFGSPLLRVQTTGSPVGNAVQTADHVATLLLRVEPYLPFGHRRQDDRYRVDLLLIEKSAAGHRRVISLLRHRPPTGGTSRMNILGQDGDLLWLQLPEIAACHLRTGAILTAADLIRANPALADLITNGFYELNGRLTVSSRDQQRVYAFDPVTGVAQPATRSPRSTWVGSPPPPTAYLVQGARVSPEEWLGLHSAAELARDFKPRLSLSKDYPFEKGRVARRLHRGRLSTTGTRTEIVEMTPLSPDDYVGGALVRAGVGAPALESAGHEGFLVLHRVASGAQETQALTRVDRAGHAAWTSVTPLLDLEQILPDPRTVVLVGKPPSVPGQVPEPTLVMIDTGTGRLSTHSLWWRD